MEAEPAQPQLQRLLDQLNSTQVGIRSLTEQIDTTTPAGRMMLQMVGAFAMFECEIIRERTRAGLESARAQGRVGGRKPKLTAQQRTAPVRGVQEGRSSMPEAARFFQVHPTTVSCRVA